MNIEILYEDEYIVAINKPSGLRVHADGIHDDPTLVDWILDTYPALKNVGEDMYDQKGNSIPKPGLVHRLDAATSGVLVIAKTADAHAYLKEQFQNRQVVKVYRAIVYGNFKQKRGLIEDPIGRSRKDSRIWSTSKEHGKNTREAKTEYEFLENAGKYAHVELRPKTGRTHQLRVHLKSIGHPVVCDYIYAKARECPEKLGRLALHSLSVDIELPNGKNISIHVDEPAVFSDFLAQ